MSVIGYKGTEEERAYNWNLLLALRMQLGFFKQNKGYETAKEKNQRSYNRIFNYYIRDED